ncbi:MAG: UDP-N-acetylmuramoyl-tripeptide--D-alanyl-D-alanine ligase [Giesbergeria sp.]
MLTLQTAFDWVSASQPQARLVGDPATPLMRVHTDTRSLQVGDLFVALRGEHFDAQAFLPQAAALGAAAALAQGGLHDAGLAGIEVPDPLAALGALAAGWRAQFDLPLIAITGSNGKTTVTQMVACILTAHAGDAALATQGNFNNAIGVPLTLLRLTSMHRFAVVELGMNHPGEIAHLSATAKPTVALVNNAQREHLEFMHTVEAVAAENGSVLAVLPQGGTAVFPNDDAFAPVWRELAGTRRVLSFGLEHGGLHVQTAHWQGIAWQVRCATPQGVFQFELAMPGRHNLRNALAAAACALAAGVPLAAIARGLSEFRAVAGRSRALQLQVQGSAIVLVDDSYNANPDSVHAAIEVLADLPSPRLLVLGDMGEVGDEGPRFHFEAGAHAHTRGIEQLFALGEQSARSAAAFPGARHFDGMEALQLAVRAALPGVASVLVKGSRFMRMERVVHTLIEAAQADAAAEDLRLGKPSSPTDVAGAAC